MDILRILIQHDDFMGRECVCHTGQFKFPLAPELLVTGGVPLVPVLALGRLGLPEVLPVIYLPEDRFKGAEFGVPLCQFRRLGRLARDEDLSWAGVYCFKDGRILLTPQIEVRAGAPPPQREVWMQENDRPFDCAKVTLRNIFVSAEFRIAVYDEV